MQDIHSNSIESTGGGGGGDRRLRPHHHHHDLKCPRCDSSNTKFCYYNNYNLSQPRHFCKSCRRYWTNGGVLRNVPVGGGIRKVKRSKTTTISSSSSAAVAPSDLDLKSSNSENSSSDSCSRTANATTTAAAPVTTAEVSGSNSTNSTPAMFLNFNESSRRFFNIPESSTPVTTVDPVQSCGGNMSSEIGTFRSLMRSWTDELPLKTEIQMPRDVKMAEDWEDHNVDDEGLFDQSYWSQNQWKDDDDYHLLNYLP
ncbi:hypothetical protein L6452_34231 [Arctium lappa]|uniref:Uncharacterized protein n=1 Tax=Arctium lappa TaxID=4217 RepID=A0ACB8YLU9_ARCLA|nr:hypothetical protein L6452_34231 [Arctium lappa]